MLYQILKCKSIIKNEPKFNGVYSRNNLPKLKDVAYVIHLDDYESIATHCIDFVTEFWKFNVLP